jgi:hypothetical protein
MCAIFTRGESPLIKMSWCKTLSHDLRESVRGSPMFQILVAGIFIMLSGLVAVGVYTLVKEPDNIIAYIMLGVCGVCVLFIFGMIICLVSCYSPPRDSTPAVRTDNFRGSNPIHSSAAPSSAAAVSRASVPILSENFRGSNPIHNTV